MQSGKLARYRKRDAGRVAHGCCLSLLCCDTGSVTAQR